MNTPMQIGNIVITPKLGALTMIVLASVFACAGQISFSATPLLSDFISWYLMSGVCFVAGLSFMFIPDHPISDFQQFRIDKIKHRIVSGVSNQPLNRDSKIVKVALIAIFIALIISLILPEFGLSGTSGSEFKGIHDKLKVWSEGYLRKIIGFCLATATLVNMGW